MALSELARFLPRVNHHNRFLRSGMRTRRHDDPQDNGHDDEPPESAMGELLHPAETESGAPLQSAHHEPPPGGH
jgi:hypothetical protein